MEAGVRDYLLRYLGELNPEALLADGLEKAFVGYTVNTHHCHVAVYDVGKCVDLLVERDGMTPEGAEEFLDFNTFCAYVGESGPLFVRGDFMGDVVSTPPQDATPSEGSDQNGCLLTDAEREAVEYFSEWCIGPSKRLERYRATLIALLERTGGCTPQLDCGADRKSVASERCRDTGGRPFDSAPITLTAEEREAVRSAIGILSDAGWGTSRLRKMLERLA